MTPNEHTQQTADYLAQFLQGYTAATHWTGTEWDMSDENGYEHADYITADYDELPAPAINAITTEALQVFAHLHNIDNGHALAIYAANRGLQSTDGDTSTASGYNLTGHDAALSAQGHGTGLWDRGIKQGPALHAATRRAVPYERTLTRDTDTDTYYYE